MASPTPKCAENRNNRNSGTPKMAIATTMTPRRGLFKEQLEAECASLVRQYGLEKRGFF
jgi:hypothetical protein